MFKTTLFILLDAILDRLYKILYFFNFILEYFFNNLVLIKYQLILIYYEKMRLKENE